MFFINKLEKYLYYSVSILLYVSYLAIFLGIYFINPEYLQASIHTLEFIICLILIARFHPFQQARLNIYDQQLIFLCATILLTNLGITNYIISKIKEVSKNHSHVFDSLHL